MSERMGPGAGADKHAAWADALFGNLMQSRYKDTVSKPAVAQVLQARPAPGAAARAAAEALGGISAVELSEGSVGEAMNELTKMRESFSLQFTICGECCEAQSPHSALARRAAVANGGAGACAAPAWSEMTRRIPSAAFLLTGIGVLFWSTQAFVAAAANKPWLAALRWTLVGFAATGLAGLYRCHVLQQRAGCARPPVTATPAHPLGSRRRRLLLGVRSLFTPPAASHCTGH